MKIAQFGTFDVMNYGDLLFPKILNRELNLSDEAQLIYVSPKGGNSVLADTVVSLGVNDLVEQNYHVDSIIIGGGNIIHLEPSKLFEYNISDEFGSSFAYPNLWLNTILSISEEVNIAWNSPGVPNKFSSGDKSLVEKALKRTNYISVRDEYSCEYLLDVCPNLNVNIIPDTAWNINKLWTSLELVDAKNDLFDRLSLDCSEDYIVFHINERYLNNTPHQRIAKIIDEISIALSGNPLLIPFGICHGDDIIADEIAKHMKTCPRVVSSPKSLLEIAGCIANSKSYIGSSMHGLITACAFGVPGLAIADSGKFKFAGLEKFIGQDNLVMRSWDEAFELSKSSEFPDYAIQFKKACVTAEKLLKGHWTEIQNTLSNTESCEKNQTREIFSKSGLNKTEKIILFNQGEVKYQKCREKYEKILKRKESDYAEKLRTKELRYNNSITNYENKIIKYRRSMSWRLTKPFRKIGKVFYVIFYRPLQSSNKFKNWLSRLISESNQILGKKWFVSNLIEQQINHYKINHENKKSKIVVYTAIFGEYDTLLMPEVLDDDVDYVCFADNEINGYGVWQIRPSPYFNTDSTRIARYVKTHPHKLFPKHNIAIWIDANISLRRSVYKYIEMIKNSGNGFGTIPHPLRSSIYEEALACKELQKDETYVIDKQIERYNSLGEKNIEGLFETNFMIIDLHHKSFQMAFSKWWQEIQNYSRRDQLSLPWVVSSLKLSVTEILPKGISVRDHQDFYYFTHAYSKRLIPCKKLLSMGDLISPYDESNYSDVKKKRLETVEGVSIDIIVCVYNALKDVKLCLSSILDNFEVGHHLIIVNDSSNLETSEYLSALADGDSRITLLINEINLGYTKSANIGLKRGTGELRILLNSDTVVCKDWALKLYDASNSSEIGVVGPLSNAAGSQSIPNPRGKSGSNSIINQLPNKYSIKDMDKFCEEVSLSNNFPIVPLVHGFCFGIKSDVLNAIGFLDEVNFDRYYGEENDFCFRAANAGFNFIVATNTFVFHRKSASIEQSERELYMGYARKKLRELHGEEEVKKACIQLDKHPMLERMREKAEKLFD